jgi:hypothetical protein
MSPNLKTTKTTNEVQVMNNKLWSRRAIARVSASLLLVISQLGFGFLLQTPTEASSADRSAGTRWSEAISVAAERRGNPWINVQNGREIMSDFAGAGRSLSVATADFEEDGMPDLVIGHATGLSGTVTLMRGNVDAVYPNTAEARERVLRGVFTSVPFLGPAEATGLPLVPDFLAAGDFDADGHFDIAVASRNGNEVLFLRGDGRGGFPFSRKIKLPGNVTALVADDFNRRDGLNDLIVGVATKQGGQVLVFEHPYGAMNAVPETFDFAAPVTSLAINFVEGNARPDLVIAAGNELAILRGRDRRLMFDESGNSAEAVHFTRKTFIFQIKALAAGEFIKSEPSKTEIALLANDGKVHLLENGGTEDANRVLSADWRETRTVSLPGGLSGGSLPIMLTARISARPVDTLVVGLGEQIHLLTSDITPPKTQSEAVNYDAQRFILAASLDVTSRTTAILPMRLNVDALSDLVVMTENSPAPAIVPTAPMATFLVDSNANVDDPRLSDGICAIDPCPVDGNLPCTGPCTYLAARQQANSNGGSSLINFSAPSSVFIAPQVGILTALTIDGTTQAGGFIEVNGTANFAASHRSGNGVDSCVFRGIVANGSSDNYYIAFGGSNSIAEGNRLGTNAAGTAVLPNGAFGVTAGFTNNLIGGTTAAARNIISTGEADGINMFSLGSGGINRVQGNFIGTDITGTVALGNRGFGVTTQGENILVGGTTAGAGNVISGTTGSQPFFVGAGINPTGGIGVLVQGNRVGTNASGTAALPNARNGIYLTTNGTFDTIGGMVPTARNLISGNGADGLDLNPTGNTTQQVLGNFIGTNAAGDAAIPNGGFGLRLNQVIPKVISNNVISGNNGGGMQIQKPNNAFANDIISNNLIGTDATGVHPLGNNGIGLILGSGVGGSTYNQTVTGNTIVASASHGVLVDSGVSVNLQNNFIGTDANLTANLFANGGDGIRFINSFRTNEIGASGAGNTIAFNTGNGINMATGDIGSTGNRITGNAIFSNGGLGIDLGGDGLTPNDPDDTENGVNRLQNFPVITNVTTGGVVTGVIDSTAGNSTYPMRIEFFSSASCDPSTYGEGQTYLGFASVAAPGGFSQAVTLIPGDTCITATATDNEGNTSEFSLAFPVGGATPTPTPTPSKLLNIATRLRVQSGDNVLIGGFIINGPDSKNVIIRGIGPSLAQFFNGTLANPTLELFQGSTLLQSNNDWKDTQRIEIEATGLQPSNDFESAIVRTLTPGAYTAVVRGNGNTSGIGVVEAYDLNQTANSKLANIATRGFVEAGDNVMIGGFIIGPATGSTARVVVRAIGPSLTAFGITGALQDPTVDLKDANGTTLLSNNDWQQGQPVDIQQLNLAPTDPRESALVTTLAPGAYTAIVGGVGNTTGVGLVEVYHVQ